MRPNRLYTKAETLTENYSRFCLGFNACKPEDWLGDGMRTWEHWAALDGIEWPKVESALDVGSFWSLTPFYLQKRMGRAGLVVASDNYQWLEERKLPNYTLDRAGWERLLSPTILAKAHDVCDLEYKDQSFDLLTCISVLEHVVDWRQAVREMARVGREVVLTVDAWPDGKPYENYGRCFSFADLHEICDLLGAPKPTGLLWDEFDGTGRTMAVIGKTIS